MLSKRALFKSSVVVYNSKLDIADSIKSNTIENLQGLLELFIDLRQVIRTAHWNIKGQHFISYHRLLDEVQSAIDDYTDEIAEKIVTFGGVADGEVTRVSNSSSLPQANILNYCKDGINCLTEVNDLLCLVVSIVTNTSDKLDVNGDKVNANYLLDLSSRLQKLVYLVEQHLQ